MPIYPSLLTNTQVIFSPNQEQYKQMNERSYNNHHDSQMHFSSDEEETINKDHPWQMV